MEKVDSTLITVSFIIFILLTLIVTFVLYTKYKKIFGWKQNLAIILSGVVLTIGSVLLINISKNDWALYIVGSILASFVIGYSIASTKVYLYNSKNKRIINSKNERKK